MDWIDLAHVRVKWQSLVNEVINLRFLSDAGEFLAS
jgi:hypothetical protein